MTEQSAAEWMSESVSVLVTPLVSEQPVDYRLWRQPLVTRWMTKSRPEPVGEQASGLPELQV